MTKIINKLRDDLKSSHLTEYLGWELIFFSIIAGIGITPFVIHRYVISLPYLPIGAAIGGLVGGILAGITSVFPWAVSKKIKLVLLLTSLACSIYGFALFKILALFIVIPAVVNSLIVVMATKVVCAQLQKSPVKWWLFLVLLVLGTGIVIFSTGVFAILGSAVFAAI